MYFFAKDNDIFKMGLLHMVVGGGLIAIGYQLGKRSSSFRNTPDNEVVKVGVSKSFLDEGSQDPILRYCIQHSTPMHPVQKKLIEETMKHEWVVMMGAPEVVQLNGALIKMLGAKKVIDIGVFTGASSLAAALALPDDGIVIACDVSEDFTAQARKYWREAGVEHKVKLVIDNAVTTLDNLIANGEENSFDFAFVDADKVGYDSYYERCLRLLKPGGAIAFDNTLWFGKVLPERNVNDESTVALKKLNVKIANDSDRVFAVQINVGDGFTLVVKR